MAIRFARQNGNWSDPLTWDGGLTIPEAGDDVYSNGFNITLDQNINVGCLNGGTTPVGVPLSPIPNMTNNTTPAGVGQAFAVQNNATAWVVFKKPTPNFSTNTWTSGVTNSGQIGYQFNTPKNIQRYSWYQTNNPSARPRSWNFEGSNDGVNYVILHTVALYPTAATYFSPVISNPSSYLYYRINVTAVQTSVAVVIDYIDMTESTNLANGYSVNGQFNSNVNRTITCTGFGIVRSTNNSVQVVNIGGSNTTTTITGNIVQYIGGSVLNGVITIAGGTNTVNITGDVYLDSLSTTGQGRLISSIISTNIINIVGNVYGYSTDPNNMRVILHQNILNITGNVTNFGGANTTVNGIIAGNTVTTVHNITGNIIGPTVNGGYCVVSGELNLTGNITCTAGIFPLSVNRLRISPSANMSIRFQDTNNANRFLYTSAQSTGQATKSDVRSGIIYGPNNDYTGTCAVPPPAAVSLGVPVDNTTGTAFLTAADMWNVPLASITTLNSIGKRLKDASTVQSTGAQLAAFLP
jgi:hypothetical protein